MECGIIKSRYSTSMNDLKLRGLRIEDRFPGQYRIGQEKYGFGLLPRGERGRGMFSFRAPSVRRRSLFGLRLSSRVFVRYGQWSSNAASSSCCFGGQELNSIPNYSPGPAGPTDKWIDRQKVKLPGFETMELLWVNFSDVSSCSGNPKVAE